MGKIVPEISLKFSFAYTNTFGDNACTFCYKSVVDNNRWSVTQLYAQCMLEIVKRLALFQGVKKVLVPACNQR